MRIFIFLRLLKNCFYISIIFLSHIKVIYYRSLYFKYKLFTKYTSLLNIEDIIEKLNSKKSLWSTSFMRSYGSSMKIRMTFFMAFLSSRWFSISFFLITTLLFFNFKQNFIHMLFFYVFWKIGKYPRIY